MTYPKRYRDVVEVWTTISANVKDVIKHLVRHRIVRKKKIKITIPSLGLSQVFEMNLLNITTVTFSFDKQQRKFKKIENVLSGYHNSLDLQDS